MHFVLPMKLLAPSAALEDIGYLGVVLSSTHRRGILRGSTLFQDDVCSAKDSFRLPNMAINDRSRDPSDCMAAVKTSF